MSDGSPKPAGTHYETLGVEPESPSPAIRKSYLNLARQYHPDNFQEAHKRDQALTRMARINAAWEVLGDQSRRDRYDRDLRMAGLLPPLLEAGALVPVGSRPPSRRLTMLPVVTLAAAAALFMMGMVLSQTGLLLAGIVTAVLAACFFFLVPLMIMRKAQKESPE